MSTTTRGSRRVRRGLFSGVVGLFALALTFGAFASVAAADDGSDQPGVSAQTVLPPTPADNNPLSSECGLSIALIVDRSGSTSGYDADYKTAAKAFVDGLVGTPSQIGLVTFNSSATLQSGYVDVSTGDGGLDAIIDGLPTPNGLTNWQDAFEVTTANFTAPVPDVAVFITDGNPTTHNGGGSDLGNGIVAANALKANGTTHITGVAVGTNISIGNIEDITGAGAGLGGADPDVHQVADPATLADQLKAFATELCGGTVTIHKQIKTGPASVADAAGWSFASVNATNSPQVTDGSGLANLDIDHDSLGDQPITESGTAGYTLSSVDCGDHAATVDGPASFTVKDVQALDVVSCTVVNTPALGSITVEKVTTHGAGGPFDFNVAGPNGTDADLSATTVVKDTAVVAGTVSNLYPGVYSITETALPEGWSLTDIDCGEAELVPVDQAVGGVAVGVHPGEQVSCTFTNDEVPSNLTIVKSASAPVSIDNGANQQVDYTLTVDNEGPADAHVDATVVDMLPAGATLVSVTPPAGVVCDTSAAPKISCTVPADQLEVADPAVEIGVRVTASTGQAVTTIVNKSIVTSSDDPAPCTVTDTDITCSETTDNYSEVSTDIPAVAAEVVVRPEVAGAVTALAFTGGNSTPWALFGALLVGLGALVVVATRRRGGATS